MTRETTYFGIRLQGEARVYKRTVIQGVCNEGITGLWFYSPSHCHSLNKFEWGTCSFEASCLSYSLLLDHLQDEKLAMELHLNFKRAVIARIDPELSWTLPATRLAEMATALAANQFCENLGREHLAEVVDFNEYKLRSAK